LKKKKLEIIEEEREYEREEIKEWNEEDKMGKNS